MDFKISEIAAWYGSLAWAWKSVIAIVAFSLSMTILLGVWKGGLIIVANVPYWLGKPRLTSGIVFETYCGQSKLVLEHHQMLTNPFEGVVKHRFFVRHGDEPEVTLSSEGRSIQIKGDVPVRYMPTNLLPPHRQVGENPTERFDWISHVFIKPGIFSQDVQERIENCLIKSWPEIMRRLRDLPVVQVPNSDTVVLWNHEWPLETLIFKEGKAPNRTIKVEPSGQIRLIGPEYSEKLIGQVEPGERLIPVFNDNFGTFDDFRDAHGRNIREFYDLLGTGTLGSQ